MIRVFVERFEAGRVDVTGDAFQHARVRRAQRGDAIHLLDGVGHIGIGVVGDLGKSSMEVLVDRVETRPRPPELEVIIPVADRDRMLQAAEKCVEFEITAWRPAVFARSHSVSPRGEGPKFREKVRARMQSALEQSGGSWMPVLHEESSFTDTIRVRPGVRHLLLDAEGAPMPSAVGAGAVVLMVGPEGGLEDEERKAAHREGWTPVALSGTTLRFETAAIAGVALVRASQLREV